ncbi:hypothetical protein V1511DRAFT_498462 [Dipodascopsis uninucleata]
MNATTYLSSYGWTPGTGFKRGSLTKPLIVHHKKDTKGLGNKSLEHESWWERVFDGRLQNLDVYNASTKSEEEARAAEISSVRAAQGSPLYRMFVKGEGLAGSIGTQTSAQTTSMATASIVTVVSNSEVTTEVLEETTIVRKKPKKENRTDKRDKKKEKRKHTSGDSKRITHRIRTPNDDWALAMMREIKKKKKAVRC